MYVNHVGIAIICIGIMMMLIFYVMIKYYLVETLKLIKIEHKRFVNETKDYALTIEIN